MGLDTILWLAGSLAEAAVIALLIYRRAWRSLPVFFIYSVWTLTASAASYVVFHNFPHSYATAYLAEMIVDSILLFGVLVGLGWSILRPLRASLPRRSLIFVAILIFLLGAALWPFVSTPAAANYSRQMALTMHPQQTFSVLRVVIFLVLAASSHFLSIGWRNRELQIATGLGFTSLVGLTVAMIHTHQATRAQYSHLNQFVVASYTCSLLYWVYSFAQQEEKRREFTPQMESLLLAVAGSARNVRVGMAEVSPANRLKRGPQ